MKYIYRVLFIITVLVSLNLKASAVDLICNFEEYNVKIPEIKAHDIHIRIKYNDNKNTISYINFGKVKKVDNIIDYNYDFLLFKIKYKYPFGETDVYYNIDRATNKITVERNEILNANRSYTAQYKGYGTCEIMPKSKVKL